MMRKILPALSAWLLAAPAALLAAEGGANPFTGDVGTAFWTMVIFFLVLLVLGRYAWGPILQGLQKREEFIRDSLKQAREDREEALATLKEYEAKLAQAKEEATEIVEEGRRDAEVVKRRVEEDARKSAEEMVARARREIGLAKESALKEIYQKAGRIASEAASRIIRKELDAAEHQRLIDEAIRQIEGSAEN